MAVRWKSERIVTLVSAVLGHSEVAFVVDYVVGSVVVDCGVVSEVACAEVSRARVLVAISLKTYTQTTPVPTNSSRPVDCEWTVILALPPARPLSLAAEVTVVPTTQSLASR